MSTPAQRLQMAKLIVDFEARRDSQGHLKIYNLPPEDGGGRYEVAGINERYNPRALQEVRGLLAEGKYDAAEAYVIDFIALDTDYAKKLTAIPSVEFYLRDCVFNRGGNGATRILQRALLVPDDGVMGPNTKAAMITAEREPQTLLRKLRAARENYEREVVGYREIFWKGLVSRWDKALAVAKTFPDSAEKPPEPVVITQPDTSSHAAPIALAVAVATAVGSAAWNYPIATAAVLAVAAMAFLAWRLGK